QLEIFEKFKQVKKDGQVRPSGTGLGLSITKKIVEHHKGRLWVESKLGQGSAFKFNLPYA
ncbi:MAG: hypothetical protein JRI64_06725, partial [Deltaproteobacteria bacterium]|nr:hypothetical protein [Deltaproteobacteria bacterium]